MPRGAYYLHTWCILFAYDIVSLMIDETQTEIKYKLEFWREELKVSRTETEYMECKFSVEGK